MSGTGVAMRKNKGEHRQEKQILESAKDIALSTETWADLSNALFDPEEGLVAKAYPTREQREQFVKTDEYRAIRSLIDAAAERTGFIEGATPLKRTQDANGTEPTAMDRQDVG